MSPPSQLSNTQNKTPFLGKLTIRIKFALFVSIIIVITISIFTTVFVLHERQRVIKDISKNAEGFAQFTTGPIYSLYVNFYSRPAKAEFDQFVSQLKEIMTGNTDIVNINLLGTNGLILFDSDEIKKGKYSGPNRYITDKDTQTMLVANKESERAIVQNGESFIEIINPYQEQTGDHIVSVRYLVSYHSLNSRVFSILQDMLITIIPLLLLSIALSVPFSIAITKPLVKLTKIAEKITAGDLSQQSDIVSNDEVGSLGKAFNQMVHNLRENIGQFHNEQLKLQASINSLSVGFIMVDKDNNIVTINHTARQALCASANSPLTTIKECTLTHIEDELQGAFDLKNLINRCFQEKKALLVREVPFQNRYLKIFVTPIITIGIIGAVILIDDITEAKVMERSKDEFFSIASHELRTPLTAIRGNTSMIKEFYSEKIKDAELNEMIQDIHESSVRLIEIVNDFLDTSRLEMGKMQFKKEEFDVLQLVEDTVKEYLTTGSQKKLYLKIEPPTNPIHHVISDRNKVKQVVINLIGNSIKFTEQGGVTIKLTEVDKFVKILISDTGRGIPPESQNLLFRKFQQAQNNILTRDTTKGTGLGLYISKLIMEGMGGGIKIESSEVGKGTTFSISIPLIAVSSPPPPPTPLPTLISVHPTNPIPVTTADTKLNQPLPEKP